MKTKILLLMLLAASVRAQTNCANIDWANNATNTARLRIAGYVDGQTIVQPGGSVFYCNEGKGTTWDGSFSRLDTNTYATTSYHGEGDMISGRSLAYAELSQSGDAWWIYVVVNGRWASDPEGSVPINLWVGYLQSTNPVGTYTLTAWPIWIDEPETLTVECFEPSENRCFVDMGIFTSPFQGEANTITNQPSMGPVCTGEIALWHKDRYGNTIDDPEPGETATNWNVVVKDGDTIAIQWPTCCNTTWGVAGQGMLMFVENGAAPVPVSRVTLCVPNFRGSLPIPQITETNATDRGPGSLLAQPFTYLTLPPLEGETNYFGYNGAIWKAHIGCLKCSTGQGTCTAWFEVLNLMRCDNPAWTHNWKADWNFVIHDLKNTPIPVDRTLPFKKLTTNSLFYIWYGGTPP